MIVPDGLKASCLDFVDEFKREPIHTRGGQSLNQIEQP